MRVGFYYELEYLILAILIFAVPAFELVRVFRAGKRWWALVGGAIAVSTALASALVAMVMCEVLEIRVARPLVHASFVAGGFVGVLIGLNHGQAIVGGIRRRLRRRLPIARVHRVRS